MTMTYKSGTLIPCYLEEAVYWFPDATIGNLEHDTNGEFIAVNGLCYNVSWGIKNKNINQGECNYTLTYNDDGNIRFIITHYISDSWIDILEERLG